MIMERMFFDKATLFLGKRGFAIIHAYALYLKFVDRIHGRDEETIIQCLSIFQRCESLDIIRNEDSVPLQGASQLENQILRNNAFDKIARLGKWHKPPVPPLFTPDEADVVINELYIVDDDTIVYNAIKALVYGEDVNAALGRWSDEISKSVRSNQRAESGDKISITKDAYIPTTMCFSKREKAETIAKFLKSGVLECKITYVDNLKNYTNLTEL